MRHICVAFVDPKSREREKCWNQSFFLAVFKFFSKSFCNNLLCVRVCVCVYDKVVIKKKQKKNQKSQIKMLQSKSIELSCNFFLSVCLFDFEIENKKKEQHGENNVPISMEMSKLSKFFFTENCSVCVFVMPVKSNKMKKKSQNNLILRKLFFFFFAGHLLSIDMKMTTN